MTVNQRCGEIDEKSVTTYELLEISIKVDNESGLVGLYRQGGREGMTSSSFREHQVESEREVRDLYVFREHNILPKVLTSRL